MSKLRHAAWLLAVLLASGALAHDYAKGGLFVDHPWVPAGAPGAEASIHLTLENRGRTPDRLVAARTSRAAAVELRAGSRTAGHGIEVPAGASLAFGAGAYGLVLIGPTGSFDAGAGFALTLHFERAGELEVTVLAERP